MSKDLFKYENKYKRYGLVAGMDEAGRGPLAGPVVCACVIMPLNKKDLIEGIDDSKKLSAKKRLELYPKILSKAISCSITKVSNKVIDEINILNATKLGMERALSNMKLRPNVVLIDAVKIKTDIRQVNIIKGDALSYNIASASILAKVYRDNLMIKLSKKYPKYHFEKHKGYGTKEHILLLKKYGKCPIHRNTFIGKFVDVDSTGTKNGTY